jgi:hypothetical protein
MPTLPVEQERPQWSDRVGEAARRTRAAIGADTRITVRLLILFIAAALGSSMAPIPWAQIALVALIGIALDVARRHA